MTFDDIKKKFLTFGEPHFSDETRLAIISNDSKSISTKLKTIIRK